MAGGWGEVLQLWHSTRMCVGVPTLLGGGLQNRGSLLCLLIPEEGTQAGGRGGAGWVGGCRETQRKEHAGGPGPVQQVACGDKEVAAISPSGPDLPQAQAAPGLLSPACPGLYHLPRCFSAQGPKLPSDRAQALLLHSGLCPAWPYSPLPSCLIRTSASEAPP